MDIAARFLHDQFMNWQALARHVLAERIRLGYPNREALANAAGVSARTLGDIETARKHSYSATTLRRLERALRWEPGSVDRVLSNSEPLRLPDPSETEPTDADRVVRMIAEAAWAPISDQMARRVIRSILTDDYGLRVGR